jgi:hypothetical protein
MPQQKHAPVLVVTLETPHHHGQQQLLAALFAMEIHPVLAHIQNISSWQM